MSPRVRTRVALASLLAGALGATTWAEAAPKAWVDPTTIELGVIEEGKLFERFVELKNVGDGVLIIEDLKPSCGCTAAAVDGAVELKAGVSQKIRFSFNTRGMEGNVKKTTTISTNDPDQPNHVVTIVADVHRAVRFEPKFLEIKDVKIKDAWSQTVQLQSDQQLELKVQKVEVIGGKNRDQASKVFTVSAAEPRIEGDRRVHDLVVTLRTPAKPQKVAEMLSVVTNQPAPHDTLKLAIRGEIVGPIRASSTFVMLRAANPGETVKQEVRLTSEETPFKVVKAGVKDSDVKVTATSSDDRKQVVVTIEYTGTEPGVNGVRNLVIETDNADQKLIEIPIRYQTRGGNESMSTLHTPADATTKLPAPTKPPAPKKTGEK